MSENVPYNETRESRQNGTRWAGLALLAVGLFFLADNAGLNLMRHLHLNFNWWALFMMIPGAIILRNVLADYEAKGKQFTRETRTQLVIGVLMLGFASAFLFNINMALFWPVALIGAGVVMLLTTNR